LNFEGGLPVVRARHLISTHESPSEGRSSLVTIFSFGLPQLLRQIWMV
jgi:hypothetical protein